MIFAHNVDQFERLAVGLSRQVLATGIRTPDLPYAKQTLLPRGSESWIITTLILIIMQ